MHFLKCFLVSALLCSAVAIAKSPIIANNFNEFDSRIEKSAKINYRLPNNTVPTNYNVDITTNVDQGVFDFTGKVKIKIHIQDDSTSVTLHARQLTIGEIELFDDQSHYYTLSPYQYDVNTELLTIPVVGETIKKGTVCTLQISYTGTLRSDQKGFYKSSYVNAEGQTKWLATTQFESTDARHGFPCYDEPQLKATFDIKVTHGTAYTAISNTNGTRTRKGDLTLTTFERTPKMSTYLVAFIISDFTSVASNNTGIPMKVFTHAEYLSQASYALSEGEKLLKAIADYVNVTYALKKMDQAAIPDFRSGAMENWGLVTYREPYLLYDPKVHLALRQLQVTSVISHEFSHQWFGNYVSPKWWKYIWLNEGFATLFENLGTHLVHPEWNIFDYFVANDVQNVLRTDSKSNTRPMSYYTETQDGIANLFDRIAYDKSGAVIRMFWHVLGDSTFKKGLNYYLTNNSYAAADEEDLFIRLDAAAKEDKVIDANVNISSIFGSWSNQKGFPLLKVQRNDNGSLTLYQEKYNDDVSSKATDESWWIPYNFDTKKKSTFDTTTASGWLPQSNKSKVLELSDNDKLSNDDWILFNRQQTGYYRVLYDEHNYNVLTKELIDGEYEKIHRINRGQIIDDLLEFAYTNRLPTKLLYNALNYLKRETEYAPWVAAKRAITTVDQILGASEKQQQFRALVANVVEPIYRNVSLNVTDNEVFLTKLTRPIAVNLACEFAVFDCLNDTSFAFDEFIHAGKNLSQHIRGVVLANGVRSANETTATKLWNYFLDSNSTDERKEIIASLPNIQNETIIQIFLNLTIKDDIAQKISRDERASIITSIVGRNQAGVKLTLSFLHESMVNVNKTVGSFTTILKSIADQVITDDVRKEFVHILSHAKTNQLITDSELTDITKQADEKLAWQKANLGRFEAGLTSSASKTAVFSSVFVLLLWLSTSFN